MRDFIRPLAIISLSGDEANDRELLTINGFNFAQAFGKYNGEEELSWVVSNASQLHTAKLKQLAKDFKQESILFVRRDRSAFLWFADGRIEKELGEWKKVDELTATRADGYTLCAGSYYITQ